MPQDQQPQGRDTFGMDESWWTGSPEAGVNRSLELGLPISPMEAQYSPGLRRQGMEIRNYESLGAHPKQIGDMREALLRRWLEERERRIAEAQGLT